MSAVFDVFLLCLRLESRTPDWQRPVVPSSRRPGVPGTTGDMFRTNTDHPRDTVGTKGRCNSLPMRPIVSSNDATARTTDLCSHQQGRAT